MIQGTDLGAAVRSWNDRNPPPPVTPRGFGLTLQAANIEAWIYTTETAVMIGDFPFECWVDPRHFHTARRLARRHFRPWMFKVLPLEFPS